MFRVCACMRFTGSIFKPYDVILGSLAAALVVIYVQAAGGGFPLDDSWIHQVYGRNLAQTGQWAFITGQPSAASTSPLYTVLLAAGYRLNSSYAVFCLKKKIIWTNHRLWPEDPSSISSTTNPHRLK